MRLFWFSFYLSHHASIHRIAKIAFTKVRLITLFPAYPTWLLPFREFCCLCSRDISTFQAIVSQSKKGQNRIAFRYYSPPPYPGYPTQLSPLSGNNLPFLRFCLPTLFLMRSETHNIDLPVLKLELAPYFTNLLL